MAALAVGGFHRAGLHGDGKQGAGGRCRHSGYTCQFLPCVSIYFPDLNNCSPDLETVNVFIQPSNNLWQMSASHTVRRPLPSSHRRPVAWLRSLLVQRSPRLPQRVPVEEKSVSAERVTDTADLPRSSRPFVWSHNSGWSPGLACPMLGCRPRVVATSILQMRKQLTERMGLVHGYKPGIGSKPEAESQPFSMPPAPRTLTALLRCRLCHKACGPSPWQQEGLGNHTGVSGHSASHSEPHRWLCHSLGKDVDHNS